MSKVNYNFENIRKRLGAVGLSLVLTTVGIGGLSGCSKNEKYKSEYSSTVYTVEKSDDQKEQEKRNLIGHPVDKELYYNDKKYSRYDRYIDFSKISKDVDLGYDYTKKNIDYVYPSRLANFINHSLLSDKIKEFQTDNRDYDEMSNAMFREFSNFVLPNSIIWAKDKIGHGLNDHNNDELIELEYLLGANGNIYIHYEYTVVSKKKINGPAYYDEEYIKKYGMPKNIKKGDYIHYESLSLVDPDKYKINLIADKQTGLGSNDKNVKEAVLNNYDDVIKPITKLSEKSDNEKFESPLEFRKFVSDKGQVKQKVKVKE